MTFESASISTDDFEEAVRAACGRREFDLQADVPVGPYLAPWVVEAYDEIGVNRNIRILVEPRNWSPEVVERLAPTMEQFQRRLRELADVDFVAVVVPGQAPAPEGLTSFGEFERFLDGFTKPQQSEEPELMGQRAIPMATVRYERDVTEHLMPWTGEGIVFCAMPFASEFNEVFFDLIAPAVDDAGLVVLRTDQEVSLKQINNRIREGIRRSALVVADITGLNANVMYEIGMAHQQDKAALLIRHDDRDIPFDIKYTEVMSYPEKDCSSVRTRLAEKIAAGFQEAMARFEEQID